MENRTSFTNLLYRRKAGNLSAEEEQYIQELIARDAEAHQIFEEFEKKFSDPALNAYLDTLDPAARFEELQIEIETPTEEASHRKRRWLVAAAIALLVLAASMYFYVQRKDPVPANELCLQLSSGKVIRLSTPGTYASGKTVLQYSADTLSFQTTTNDQSLHTLYVPRGKHYYLRFSDQSSVELNAATTLQFSFAATAQQEVFVDGEAYFNILPNEQRSFVVHTAAAEIKVLGTTFNVKTYDNRFVTSLVAGSINVSSKTDPAKQIKLSPGHEAILDSANTQFKVQEFETDEALSWLTSNIQIWSQPFYEIGKIIERSYGVHIIYDSDSLKNRICSGAIDIHKPLDSLLHEFATRHHIIKGYTIDYDSMVLIW